MCTNNRRSEREIKETIPFTITSKRIKYLRINLPKEAKDLYLENNKIHSKEIKGDTNRWRASMFLDWKKNIVKMTVLLKAANGRCRSYQIASSIFHRIGTTILTVGIPPCRKTSALEAFSIWKVLPSPRGSLDKKKKKTKLASRTSYLLLLPHQLPLSLPFVPPKTNSDHLLQPARPQMGPQNFPFM